jgi:hypothetical protein
MSPSLPPRGDERPLLAATMTDSPGSFKTEAFCESHPPPARVLELSEDRAGSDMARCDLGLGGVIVESVLLLGYASATDHAPRQR